VAFRVSFTPSLCQGYANCLIEAPEIWDFDEDNDVAVLKDDSPDASLLEKARASARGCPAHAISVEEQS
jgi:ferredoxin